MYGASQFGRSADMSGAPPAFTQMLEVMNHGGRIAMLGIPPASMAIDWNQVIFKGLEIRGIYGREMFETWYKMANLLQSGLDVQRVITHRLPASDFDRAFEIVASGGTSSGRPSETVYDLAELRARPV